MLKANLTKYVNVLGVTKNVYGVTANVTQYTSNSADNWCIFMKRPHKNLIIVLGENLHRKHMLGPSKTSDYIK